MPKVLVVLSNNDQLSKSRDGYTVHDMVPSRGPSSISISVRENAEDQHVAAVATITIHDDGRVVVSSIRRRPDGSVSASRHIPL